jgi:hypothetical protein
MAVELLRAKGDIDPLGKSWSQSFVRRHPDLCTKFVPPLNKSRVKAKDEDQIRWYFALYSKTKQEYNIHNDDMYNINEKGVIVRVLAKLKVVCSCSNRKPYITQPGNKE